MKTRAAFPTRKPLKKLSDRKARILKAIRSIHQDKLRRMGDRCVFSGRYGATDPAHIIRQSDSIRLQDNERNIIPALREYHNMFDNGKVKELYDMFPWRVRAVIERMKALDYHYAHRFASRHLTEEQYNEIFRD